MAGTGDREGSRSAFCSGIMEEGQAQGQRERLGGWSCAHRRVGTTRMHNDVVKLRAGAVQREANHTGRSYPESRLNPSGTSTSTTCYVGSFFNSRQFPFSFVDVTV